MTADLILSSLFFRQALVLFEWICEHKIIYTEVILLTFLCVISSCGVFKKNKLGVNPHMEE
jgi:hypothetical protein